MFVKRKIFLYGGSGGSIRKKVFIKVFWGWRVIRKKDEKFCFGLSRGEVRGINVILFLFLKL